MRILVARGGANTPVCRLDAQVETFRMDTRYAGRHSDFVEARKASRGVSTRETGVFAPHHYILAGRCPDSQRRCDETDLALRRTLSLYPQSAGRIWARTQCPPRPQ